MTAPDPVDHLPLPHLTLHVLLALGEGPLHGYGIIKDVEARSGGRVTVRSGTLYTTLQRLLEAGLVEEAPPPDGGSSGRRRRGYALTPLGRRVVAAEAERLEGVLATARRRRLAGDGGPA